MGGDFFGTEDGLISFAECEAAHTRSGQSFIPSVGGVTANNRMLDLGIRLAQASSRLGVGKGTPSPFFHLRSCEDRGCGKRLHHKRGESEQATLCSGYYAVQHTPERPLNGNVAFRERAAYGDHDLLAPSSPHVSKTSGK